MERDRVSTRGEYWWRRPEPPLAMLAGLDLPRRFGVAVSRGADDGRESLSLVLQRSETGLDHLALTPLEQRGAIGTDTAALFALLLNTTVTLLQRHCSPQLSLGGMVPTRLRGETGIVELPWQSFGFQLLRSNEPDRRRVFTRVGKLQTLQGRSRTLPLTPPWEEVQWRNLAADAVHS